MNEVIVYDKVGSNFLKNIDFDILALGEDHIGGRFGEASKWCEEYGKKVVRLKRTEDICSSEIKKFLLNK